tara:strand:+ start:602 stop:1471 length:870 start_codon:yes stop_codon:yes gene_type:complete
MDSVDVSPTQGFSHIYDRMNNVIGQTNPMVLTVLSVIIIFYFVIFSYLGYTASNSTGYAESRGLGIIEIIMWGLIIFLVLINGIQYFFKIDVNANISNIFNKTPELDLTISPEKKLVEKSGKKRKIKEAKLETSGSGEVFNIPGNEYTYSDAKALCKAYGGNLASYTQIENAYKSGAEWCNYGWSSDQMALYPTQKVTWNKLQKIKGHEHNCGRPGVNGGYIKNNNVRFGVNCFAPKPKITEEEQTLMDNATPYPLTPDELKVNNMTHKYKKNLHSILLAPFSYDKWSE